MVHAFLHVACGPGKVKNRIRFEAAGFGESRPAAGNNNEKGRALNRRVDILVVP
jgi:flagellar motor protein MotB